MTNSKKTNKRGPKPQFTEQDILRYSNEHNCSHNEALYRLRLETSDTERAKFIKAFCIRTNKSVATAEYAWSKTKNGDNYRCNIILPTSQRNKHQLSEFDKITVTYNQELEGYNYNIRYDGVLLRQRKHGDRLFITNPNTHKEIAVSTVVFCLYNQTDIEGGYVVDHIDNNVLNNNPENLQLLTWSENIRKNSTGHNQYTKK